MLNLMSSKYVSYLQALTSTIFHVRSRRSAAKPNPGFQKQLKEYAKEMAAKGFRREQTWPAFTGPTKQQSTLMLLRNLGDQAQTQTQRHGVPPQGPKQQQQGGFSQPVRQISYL